MTTSKTHDPLKCQRTAANAIEYETRVVHPTVYAQLAVLLERLKHADDRVCPNWNPSRINKLIRAVSTAEGWFPELVWCAHGMRHGAAADARIRYKGMKWVGAFLGHEDGSACTEHYARTNEERVAQFKLDLARVALVQDKAAVAARAAGKPARKTKATKAKAKKD